MMALNLKKMEAAAQALIAASSQPPYLYQLGPAKGRLALEKAQSIEGPMPTPEVLIEDRTLPVGPSGSLQVRIVRPKNGPALLPVILYVHGAGWVFGSAKTHDRLIRELSVGAQAAVVFPTYSLSPEAKFPTAIEELYAAALWIETKGSTLGLDAGRFAIAGDSVGGNMAAAVTLLAKERGAPSIGLQLLFYPVTNAAFDTPSYNEFAEGFVLSRAGMQWFWDQYTSNNHDRERITASPLRASLRELGGLPPALVITAEADVLRDEGEAYANKLREAGVKVSSARFQGITHDFVMLNVLSGTEAARGAIAMAIDWLRKGWKLETMMETAIGGAAEQAD
jgi:acetyl esterase